MLLCFDMNTVLLTSTIEPNPHILFLNIKDAWVRYKQYVQNIIKYICFSDFDSIVFCENSWFEIEDSDMLQWIAKIFWKKLEILQFDGDHDQAVKMGRWFWENEIIEYAIEHSKLINNSWWFIKITWRYRCENINSIIHGSSAYDICFSKLMPVSLFTLDTKAINTALFKTSVWFFNEFLSGAGKEVNDNKINFLEHVYFRKLKKIASDIHPLAEYPQMRWITGQWTVLKKWFLVETVMYLLHKLWITKV